MSDAPTTTTETDALPIGAMTVPELRAYLSAHGKQVNSGAKKSYLQYVARCVRYGDAPES